MTTTALEIHGHCDDRFAPVRDEFIRNFEERGDVRWDGGNVQR